MTNPKNINSHTNSHIQHSNTPWFDPVPSKDHGQRILFTGPDGMKDQEMSIAEEYRYIEIGTMSKEGTSELDYLYRQGPNPKGQSYFAMKRKHQQIASVGWRHEDADFLNKKMSNEGNNHMHRGEFRQEAENRNTHLYQSPYYEKVEFVKKGFKKDEKKSEPKSETKVKDTEK